MIPNLATDDDNKGNTNTIINEKTNSWDIHDIPTAKKSNLFGTYSPNVWYIPFSNWGKCFLFTFLCRHGPAATNSVWFTFSSEFSEIWSLFSCSKSVRLLCFGSSSGCLALSQISAFSSLPPHLNSTCPSR